MAAAGSRPDHDLIQTLKSHYPALRGFPGQRKSTTLAGIITSIAQNSHNLAGPPFSAPLPNPTPTPTTESDQYRLLDSIQGY